MKNNDIKLDGWINLNKPLGMTSTQCIGKLRGILRPIYGKYTKKLKIGHMGTLDPLADGVLPIAMGEACKTITYMEDHLKEYEFSIFFGLARDTDDAEGVIIEESQVIPSIDEVNSVLNKFIGNIDQIPPLYSAIKVNGKRAYDLVRSGKAVDSDGNPLVLKARSIVIKELEVLEQVSPNEIKLRCLCGVGTYIRSLARDIAKELGSCGYVSFLRRTQNGCFKLKLSKTLENIEQIVQNTTSDEESLDVDYVKGFLNPIDIGLDGIPVLDLNLEEVKDIRQGKFLNLEKFIISNSFDPVDGSILRVNHHNQIVAIVKMDTISGFLRPVKVFNL